MKPRFFRFAIGAHVLMVAAVIAGASAGARAAGAVHFGFDTNHVILINYSKKIFPIGITLPPTPNSKTPDGVNAFKEFHDAGMLFMRTGIAATWDAAGIAQEKLYQDAAAQYGLYCQPWLRNLATSNSASTDAQLTTVVNTFKAHPGMGMWKGADEPWWGGTSVANCQHCYSLIKSLDSDHLVWIVEAPRGTSSDLSPYNVAVDIHGVDIYPVSYPPGNHLPQAAPNKQISVVGDWTDIIYTASGSTKPIMMTLQIAFSGTTPPTRQLRFPTFPQERYMAYQAIIHGARGLQFFGGTLSATLNSQDTVLGWNWTFWNNVLKRLFLEIGDTSPLQPALVAPNSSLAITVSTSTIATDPNMSGGISKTPDSSPTVEFIVREVGANDLYIIACRKELSSALSTEATFYGLPSGYTQGTVMYEEPAMVNVLSGSFTHRFNAFDVHVYHFTK